ncbi:hypothetical protein [Vulgatibacter incomptus]|uniref:hypothetical protein n=1 Tax=Vulgatibacter incomptus TaxID=1391653 RepID=UPI00067FD390|nr:hypothetical protein [Vulgatibacter incomptus]
MHTSNIPAPAEQADVAFLRIVESPRGTSPTPMRATRFEGIELDSLRNPWTVLAPLPATAVGMSIAGAHGVPWSAYAPNLAAIVLGATCFHAARRVESERLSAWAPGLAALGILATLVGPSIDGVHRWVSMGAMRLNMSLALAQLILFGLTAARHGSNRRAVLAALVAQIAHVVQPDAGQASALAAGALPVLLDRSCANRTLGTVLALALGVLAGATWLRDDPLPAVEHVERILILAYLNGPLWVTAVVLAGAALLLPLVTSARMSSAAVQATLSYIVASFVVAFVGSFPVPVFGAGAGPVLGWYALLTLAADGKPNRPSSRDSKWPAEPSPTPSR